MNKWEFIYSGEPKRADIALCVLMEGYSRSALAALIDKGFVLVNGETISKKKCLNQGDKIIVTLEEAPQVLPETIKLDIRYEDEHLLVVNKPKGMVVHPATGNYTGTLVNALLHHCENLSDIGGKERPGIVHRIDKDTSGLLIVAKTNEAHVSLGEQIKKHSFIREYDGVVFGRIKDEVGIIDAPIGRHPFRRKEMAVTNKNAKPAMTYYSVISRYEKYTHLRLKLETGRTHQIRVHLSSLGYPVAGDPVYAGKRKAPGLSGQCLHASHIAFSHPISGEVIDITAELPQYFTEFLARIGKKTD